jgi:DinB superfamily
VTVDRCAECGFDPSELRPPDTAVAVRSFVRRYQTPLLRGLPGEDLDAIVGRSPGPGVWSALEYSAHVRDIFRVYDSRVRSALARDEPGELVVDWEGMVASASPSLERKAVADDLADAAISLATTLSELTPMDWELSGRDGRGHRRPVRDLALVTVHEGSHHLLDVGRALRTARGR